MVILKHLKSNLFAKQQLLSLTSGTTVPFKIKKYHEKIGRKHLKAYVTISICFLKFF